LTTVVVWGVPGGSGLREGGGVEEQRVAKERIKKEVE